MKIFLFIFDLRSLQKKIKLKVRENLHKPFTDKNTWKPEPAMWSLLFVPGHVDFYIQLIFHSQYQIPNPKSARVKNQSEKCTLRVVWVSDKLTLKIFPKYVFGSQEIQYF